MAEESTRDIHLRKDHGGRTDPSLMSKQNVLTRAKKKHAFACVQANRLSEAHGLFQNICERDPRDAASWFMLGTVCGRMGSISDAEAALRKALAVFPDFAEARLNLGHALELQGKLSEAEDCYRNAATLKPDLADAHESLGRLAYQRGDLHVALDHYQLAMRLHPSQASTYLGIGKIKQRLGAFSEASQHFEQALRVDPNNAEAYYLLAGAHLDAGHFDEALQCARRAQQLKADFISAIALEAAILVRRGEMEAAHTVILPVLERYREYPELALTYAQLCRESGDAQAAVERLEILVTDASLDQLHRELAHFRLGELYDAAGEYEKAITHYHRGNRLKNAQFDKGAWTRHIDHLMDTFSADAIARAPRAANCSERPLFVVGMPRSGTTLVTQILASHPAMASAGELPDIGSLAAQCEMSLTSTPGGDGLMELGREQCDELANRYLSTLTRIAPHAQRVIDKMPENFLHLGLITLLFPVSRIIHCVRDPLDTCLSCYFQDFGGDLPYAYDLEDIGFYYREYQRLMTHWRGALQIPVLEVRYEDLVTNSERVAREMVKFCGFKWDAQCLEFHRHGNAAATSSFMQVRKPVYQTSVGRWKHYEDHIEPLRRALAK